MQIDQKRERRLLLMATYASVGVALTLIVLKTLAWLYSGSASIMSSLIDSLVDSMASIITMLAVRYSLKPADKDHRFGHGKAQSAAAIAQAAFVSGSGLLLLLFCLQRLLDREPYVLGYLSAGMVVISFSLVLTLGLLALQTYVIRATHSEAIRADRLHYKSDILMNVAVVVALLSAYLGWPKVDLVFGMLIACYISYGAVRMGYEAAHTLMDKELPPEVDEQILAVATAHPEVLGVHDLRTRQAGSLYIIQFHIEIKDDTSLLQAHRIADEVEAEIRTLFPHADIIIHQDPLSVVPAEWRQMKYS